MSNATVVDNDARDAWRQPPGRIRPSIDRNRCEGKGACVATCPFDLFELGVLPVSERAAVSIPGRVKGNVNGWRQVLTPGASACEACGRCVSVCPESAITLTVADTGWPVSGDDGG